MQEATRSNLTKRTGFIKTTGSTALRVPLLSVSLHTVDETVAMNSLLRFATEAHGGLDRWNQLSSLTANVSVTGALWQIKRKPDILKDVRLELTLHLEHLERLVTHFVGQNKRFFFTRSRVAIEDEQGKTIDSKNDPRTAFDGQSFEPPWDELQIAYFNSYALWTYLTIPFLYAHPAFITEELPPWQEDGEEWRPLKAIFPSTIASLCQQRVSYFGPDGLLRRHEYVVDVMGGARGLNYAYDYREFDGIKVPTTRRVMGFDENQRKIPNPVLVAIDIRELAFQ